jgi:hypothetical protein
MALKRFGPNRCNGVTKFYDAARRPTGTTTGKQ